MRSTLLAGLILSMAAQAQSNPTPFDCQFSGTLTAASPTSATYYNKGPVAPCVSFRVTYHTLNATGVSISLQGTGNLASGQPDTAHWTNLTAFAGSANPATGTAEGSINAAYDYYPWIQLTVSLTGTGASLNYTVLGYKGTSASNGSAGGGSVTAVTGTSPIMSSLGSTPAISLDTTKVPQKFFGTSAPGSVTGNLPGDLFTDTTAHNEYVCGAPSGTAAPSCTSVSVGGWLLVNGTSDWVYGVTNKPFIDVREYGADPTGAADSTAGIQNAINVALSAGGGTVMLPGPGPYKVLGMITATGPHITLTGSEGKTTTTLYVPNSFNLSSFAVIKLVGAADTGCSATGSGLCPGSPTIENLRILFQQPDTATRGNLVAYPPAIGCDASVGCSGATISHLHIALAMTGVYCHTNCSQLTMDDVNISAFTTGVDVDNALDIVRWSNVHVWPFEATGNQYSVMQTSPTTAFDIGRADGLQLANVSAPNIWRGFNLSNKGNGCSVIQGSAVWFMDMNVGGVGAQISCGSMDLSDSYAYGVDGTGIPLLISDAGGELSHFTCDACAFYLGSTPSDATGVYGFQASGYSHVIISNSKFWGQYNSGAQSRRYLQATDNASVILTGNRIGIAPTQLATSVPIFSFLSSSSGIITSNQLVPVNGGSTGTLLAFENDSPQNTVANNSFGGWTVTYPSTYPPGASAGRYQTNVYAQVAPRTFQNLVGCPGIIPYFWQQNNVGLSDVAGEIIDLTCQGGVGLLVKGSGPGSNYPSVVFSLRNTNAIQPQDILGAGISGIITSNTAGAESMDLSFGVKPSTGAGQEALHLYSNGTLGIAAGGSPTTLVCWKADGKTLGYATMSLGNISACN
jgi:hypothetical protein